MDAPKRKMTARVNLSAQPLSRAPSPLKVKAKINSVSMARTTPSPSPSAVGRAPSPSKQPNNGIPRANTVKARVVPGSSSPTRHRTMLSDVGQPRSRRVSVISKPPSPPSKPNSPTPDLLVPKIKSKITTGMARTDPMKAALPAPLTQRNRTPSMASSASMGSSSLASTSPSTSPVPQIYPITAAVSAANPHRFASVRPSPTSATHHSFQPFAQTTVAADDANVNYGVNVRRRPSIGQSKPTYVDPAAVPLPPNSPPTSAVSFSSRSSIDYESSGSSVHINGGLTHTRSRTSIGALNGLGLRDMTSPVDERRDSSVDTQHGKEKAEAKTNRKIADLEITNKSLLAINISLENTKNKQAKEIRELRRKLRESRLVLPPSVYKEKLQEDAVSEEEDSEEDSGDDLPEELLSPKPGEKETKQDAAYRRIKLMLDGLLGSGQKALETTPADFADSSRKGTKVLTADEIERWQEGREPGDVSIQVSDIGEDDGEADMSIDDSRTPDRRASLSDDEDEVEGLVRASSSSLSARSPSPPGILVSQPP